MVCFCFGLVISDQVLAGAVEKMCVFMIGCRKVCVISDQLQKVLDFVLVSGATYRKTDGVFMFRCRKVLVVF